MRYFIKLYEIETYSTLNYAFQSPYRFFLFFISMCAMIIITYIFQVVIHESGHLIFGLITGYRFSSFRILSKVIIKKDGKLSLRINASNGAGQCLMLPPKHHKPYILYNIGGIILDIISAFIFSLIAFSNNTIGFHIRTFSLLISFMGVGSAVINGLPILIKNNDTDNCLKFKRHKATLHSYYTLLELLALLQDGKTYSELPYDKIKLESNQDIILPFVENQKIWECYYFMDNQNWSKAKKCLAAYEPYINKISKDILEAIQLEKLFLSIVMRDNPAIIDELYNKVISIMKKRDKDLDILRIKIAYEIYRSKTNIKLIEKYIKRFNKISRNYLYQGRSKFNKKMLQAVIDTRGC